MRRFSALLSVALLWTSAVPSWAGPEPSARAPDPSAIPSIAPLRASALPPDAPSAALAAAPIAALPQAQVQPAVPARPQAAWPRSVNLDAVLDTVNPFALFNNKLLGLSHNVLAPRSFFDGEGKGQVVGVNGVAGGEMYLRSADYMAGKDFGARLYRAGSPEHLVHSLVEAYRVGGPIARLVIAAHGSSGSFSIGGYSMNGSWARDNLIWLKSLPADLFAPGAKVSLISCSVAQGYVFWKDAGVSSLRELFSPLLKQGGTVIAATRYVDPELRLIPGRYKSVVERLLRHLVILPLITPMEIVHWLISDWRSKFRKVLRIEIAPDRRSGTR